MKIAVIGAGNRARKYLSCLPGEVCVSYLAEPDPLRLRLTAEKYNIPAGGRLSDAEELFSIRPEIDAVIIAAPDHLHVPLALKAAECGWHILLEKPAAPSLESYMALLEASRHHGVQVGLCLEMRFHPFFRRIKEIVDSGVLGRILEIDHTEHVGPERMAHTFVRGLWSRREDSGPIFLSKCCHDADFLLWLTGARVKEVNSFGCIMKFRPDRAAKGAAERCINCPVTSCPYSAVKLYRERREWIDGFDIPRGSTLETVIDAELKEGRYGRCVYHCSNDVYDTQDVEATVIREGDENPVRVHMHLEGTSLKEGRTIVIRGSTKVLIADTGRIFVDGLVDEDYSSLLHLPLHAGADRMLLESFFKAISNREAPMASLQSALEGHRLCYLADSSDNILPI